MMSQRKGYGELPPGHIVQGQDTGAAVNGAPQQGKKRLMNFEYLLRRLRMKGVVCSARTKKASVASEYASPQVGSVCQIFLECSHHKLLPIDSSGLPTAAHSFGPAT